MVYMGYMLLKAFGCHVLVGLSLSSLSRVSLVVSTGRVRVWRRQHVSPVYALRGGVSKTTQGWQFLRKLWQPPNC